MSAGLPLFVGSVNRQAPLALAEHAIARIGELRRTGKDKRPAAYAVGMDLAGRIVVDRMGTMPPAELLMTCTHQSDPDVLAEEIQAERDARDGVPKTNFAAMPHTEEVR